MRLQIFHRTRYVYRAEVRDSYNEVRLRPATDNPERLEFFLLNVNPPVRLQHFRDAFRNYVHFFEIPEPHAELNIESQAVMRTASAYVDGLPEGVEIAAVESGEDAMLRDCKEASALVEVTPEIWRMAVDILAGERDIFRAASALSRFVHENWAYVPAVTDAATHVREVFASRAGVCQDFAHVMIALCRAAGIPARYVSGYLYNGSGSSLRGTQASHAWCEVYIPGRGWYGLDPTNNTLADERHAKIATGRDYGDVAPVVGRFGGPVRATSQLFVQVEVEEI